MSTQATQSTNTTLQRLTLRLPVRVIRGTKAEAGLSGKSVSDFVCGLLEVAIERGELSRQMKGAKHV